MNTETILRLLNNSGFYAVRTDGVNVFMEDPSCILRSFETFIEYAWVGIFVITGLLLFGLAISMIRGAKHDTLMTLRNLILIFGALSAVGPIVNMLWGGDLFARGCRTVQVSLDEINEILGSRNSKLSTPEYDLYEEFDIYDSGVIESDTPVLDTPEPVAPVVISDAPTIQPDTQTDIAHDDTPINIADVPVRAQESGRDVIYTLPDGSRHKRIGGTRAWRNSNPGNIRYSEFSRRVGAIGSAGGFAVFPDEATGMYAIKALLRTDSYNKLTIAGAISRYAPPSENDTAAYHRRLEQLTGLSINMRMADLTDAQLTQVANAIRTVEGWKPGTIQRI